MLQQRGDAMHCTDCGREYDAQDEDLVEGGECPSDDCPSNDVPGEMWEDLNDPQATFDIEYNH